MNTEELKQLAEAATPGPWEIDDMLADITGIEVWSTDGMLCESISEENARYIAAANPAAVLELIRQRDELLAALKVFADKYNSAPDGDLGIGLVNGDFFRAIDAITKSEAP